MIQQYIKRISESKRYKKINVVVYYGLVSVVGSNHYLWAASNNSTSKANVITYVTHDNNGVWLSAEKYWQQLLLFKKYK